MTGLIEKGIRQLTVKYEKSGREPDKVAKIGLNPGWNAVIGDRGSCGVALSFRNNNPSYHDEETVFPPDELQKWIGMSLFDLAREKAESTLIRDHSLAVACLNALSQPFLTEEECIQEGYHTRVPPGLVGKDDVVVIVGYGGLVDQYSGQCRELHVTDMRPPEAFRTLIIGETVVEGPLDIHVHAAEENQEILSRADVVFITGSTLVNDTLDEVISHAPQARIRCLYGSSAQLLPSVLIDEGIDCIMSVAITDPVRFEHDILHTLDLETALKRHQRKYTISRL